MNEQRRLDISWRRKFNAPDHFWNAATQLDTLGDFVALRLVHCHVVAFCLARLFLVAWGSAEVKYRHQLTNFRSLLNLQFLQFHLNSEEWLSSPSTSSTATVRYPLLFLLLPPLLQQCTSSPSSLFALANNPPSAECIFKKQWQPRPASSSSSSAKLSAQSAKPPLLKQPSSHEPSSSFSSSQPQQQQQRKTLSAEDDAKLIFGTVFSLRSMVRKLGGPEDE